MDIKIAKLLTQNNGKLPTYVDNMDYPIYYTTKDNKVLCPKCANAVVMGEVHLDHLSADDISDYKVNWDNDNLMCYSNHKIDTATIDIEADEGVLELDED